MSLSCLICRAFGSSIAPAEDVLRMQFFGGNNVIEANLYSQEICVAKTAGTFACASVNLIADQGGVTLLNSFGDNGSPTSSNEQRLSKGCVPTKPFKVVIFFGLTLVQQMFDFDLA